MPLLRFLRLAALLVPGLLCIAQAQTVARRDRTGDAIELLLPITAATLAVAQQDWQGLEQFGLSAALSQGTTAVLKDATHRPRPDGTGKSFPSGHASMAFVSAAYVHRRYGLAWAAPMYGLATVGAYSRVHTRHHYTRDVAAGALIGVGSAFLLTDPAKPGMAIAVGAGPGAVTVVLASRW